MLDWNRFETLPGDPTTNFELLCRGVVRRHYGHLGVLQELKNQPGVEFHLTLDRDHPSLGMRGEKIGWQCKWFKYKTDGTLSANAKHQIQHSLEKTREHVEGVDHWFLWTHRTLSKQDATWFKGLEKSYSFKLHCWNELDLEQLLSGPALDLRNSYFGELALTNYMLREQHEKSVAPIAGRWLHDVHQVMDEEMNIRQALGQPVAWEEFKKAKGQLAWSINQLSSALEEGDYEEWRGKLQTFKALCDRAEQYCEIFEGAINGNSLETIRSFRLELAEYSKDEIYDVLRQLRRRNLPLSLVITNSVKYLDDVYLLLSDALDKLSVQQLAIIADAGGGKTQMAAELTAPTSDRPAGILILGRQLKAGQSLDSIAKNLTFYQQPVPSFEALLGALDAAAERASCRLPIVIDGLNEAEDPREWKPLLSSIEPVLKKYPNVVLVYTLRTGERPRRNNRELPASENSRETFAQQSLPDNVWKLESHGFNDKLTLEAIRAYFRNYQIIADPLVAPISFFSHPLNLKIFCEVTNRSADKPVKVAEFPSSIYSLFGAQMEHSAQKISEMVNLKTKYRIEDVNRALYFLGELLWTGRGRCVSESSFTELVAISNTSWDDNIINLLAQEGVLFRNPSTEPYTFELTPVYDRLGGYLIANYLLLKNQAMNLDTWMRKDEFLDNIFGDISVQHELSQDIFHALVAMAPKLKGSAQVWRALPSNRANHALSLSYLIDKEHFDSETLERFEQYIQSERDKNNIFSQLRRLAPVVGHPLNADFLSKVLGNLTLTERDLTWTEHYRRFARERTDTIRIMVEGARKRLNRQPEVARLQMIHLCWILSSTVIALRDLATEALLIYGIKYPEQFLPVAKSLIEANDPYVVERVMAVSYAIAASNCNNRTLEEEFREFSRIIFERFLGQSADLSTTHLLTRDYASCLVKTFLNNHPSGTWMVADQDLSPPFSKMPRKNWGKRPASKNPSSHKESPFRMDFENYTIGSLIDGRANYDYKHPKYVVVRDEILWRIENLGWDITKFEAIDSEIEQNNSLSRGFRPKTERYGKKYSWIAFYEMAGEIRDQGSLPLHGDYRFLADIDPFFPEIFIDKGLIEADYLGSKEMSTEDWINQNDSPDLTPLLRHADQSDPSSWALLEGYVNEQSRPMNRNFHLFIKPLFLPETEKAKFDFFLSSGHSIDWPQTVNAHYVYSGEFYSLAREAFDSETGIDVVVGTEKRVTNVPEIRINDELLSAKGEKCFEVPKYEEVGGKITTINYSWDFTGRTHPHVSFEVLAPWIVEELELTFEPMRLAYLDGQGELAVRTVRQKDEIRGSTRELTFIRKDLLEKLVASTGLYMVTQVSGDRQFARINDFHTVKQDEDPYKDFQFYI